MNEVVEDRRIFFVSIVFDNPMEATVQVAARDEAHARQIIEEQFKDRKGLRIVDIFDAVALQKNQQEMDKLTKTMPDVIDADYQDITTPASFEDKKVH